MPLSEINDTSPSMPGHRDRPNLSAKGVGTRHLLPFALEPFRTHARLFEVTGTALLSAGDALTQYSDLCDVASVVLTRSTLDATAAAFGHWCRALGEVPDNPLCGPRT